MTSVPRWFAVVLLAALVISFPSCHHPEQQGPQYVMLTYNNGKCQQNGSSGVIDLWSNLPVIYQGAATLTEFQINFQNGCPFSSCPVNSPNGRSDNVGQLAVSSVGNTFNYSSMMIDNQNCTLGGAMGVRIKSGP